MCVCVCGGGGGGGGGSCCYLDCFLQFRNIRSKRGNDKPPCLIEIHSEIGIMFYIAINHGPNTSEIVLKFALNIDYDI